MSAAIFKLESFDHPPASPARPAMSYDRDDLDQAFADGYATGKAEADGAHLTAFGARLAELAALVAQDEARRAALRAEAVAALSPILAQILDLMAPAAASRRLEEALLAELSRLAERVPPVRARITCPTPLRPLAEHCLKAAGAALIELDCRDDAELAIRLDGGRIEICPADAARELHALIAEIREETPQWTH